MIQKASWDGTASKQMARSKGFHAGNGEQSAQTHSAISEIVLLGFIYFGKHYVKPYLN